MTEQEPAWETERGQMVALEMKNVQLCCSACGKTPAGFTVLRLKDGWEVFCPDNECQALLLKVVPDRVWHPDQ